MIPYLICFIVTPLATYIAEKYFQKEKRAYAIFFSLIAILVPSVFAGLRDLSVGTDATIYVEPVLRKISGMSLFKAFKTFSLENGYIFFVYLVSFFTKNPNVLLFFINLIIITFIYLAAYKCKDKMSMTIFMTVYILYMYTKSLNIMRQSIAIAIFIYSLTYLFDKNYLKTGIFFIIAFLFHSSIIFCGAIYILYAVNNSKLKSNAKIFIFLAIDIIFFIISINIKSIVQFLSFDLGLIPTSYYNYFSDVVSFKNNYMDIFIKLIILFVSCCIVSFDKSEDGLLNNMTLIESIIIGIIFTISMNFIGQLGEIYRISYPFILVGIIFIFPKAFNIIKNDSFNRVSSYVIIVMLLLFQWVVYYVINEEASLYPYIFM